MLYLAIKAMLSGVIIATVSEIAKRSPSLGGLVASLPLVSVLAMIWLWHDTRDAERIAAHAEGTLWFVVPSLPMFLLMPWLLRHGYGFWTALGLGCLLTIVLTLAMLWIGPRFGLRI
jgi:F0F1-type ATP synthase assembly protein I